METKSIVIQGKVVHKQYSDRLFMTNGMRLAVVKATGQPSTKASETNRK